MFVKPLVEVVAADGPFQPRDSFPDWNAHPLFGDFSRRLYPTVRRDGWSFDDQSFVVISDDEPCLLAACTTNNQNVSMFGLPCVLALRKDLGAKQAKNCLRTAIEHISILSNGGTAILHGGHFAGPLTPVDLACIDYQGRPSVHVHGVIDVANGEQEIHRSVRKSFRSLINWGRKNLSMTYVNAAAPDRQAFDAYCDFYRRTAGGSTHSESYWVVYWEEIVAGRGELSLGYLPDKGLVGGTFVVDGGRTSYYASGAYDRSLFDLPLAHFPIFDAAVRSGQRGQSTFDLGEIVPKGEAGASDKEVQIGFFKKGFAQSYDLRLAWTLDFGTG